MAEPTGLKITRIHNAPKGAKNENEEWVQIANDGSTTWDIRGWLLTDETSQQLRPHIYRFPQTLADGSDWRFAPGELIYVFTGAGRDRFLATPAGGLKPQFHFNWGRNAMVWSNSGDAVYLRNPDGTFATQPLHVP